MAGRAIIGSLRAELSANASRFTKDLAKAGGAVGKFAQRNRESFRTVGIAASALAGGITAVGAGIVALGRRGAEVAPVATSFDALARSVGSTRDEMLGLARSATKGLITDFEIMKAANKALLLGIPVTAESFADLAQKAVVLGNAMGLEATQSLDDLTTALGRGSAKILDNLGLMVDTAAANDTYAASLGTTVDQLTEADKKQAFFNAALAAADEKLDTIGGITLTFGDRVNVAWNRVKDLADALAEAIAQSPALNAGFAAAGEALEVAFGSDQRTRVQRLTKLVEGFALGITVAADVANFVGRVVALAISAINSVIKAGMTGIAGMIELGQKSLAAFLSGLAKIPGVGKHVQGLADAFRDSSVWIEGARQDLARQTREAVSGGLAQQEVFSGISESIHTVRQAMLNARDAQDEVAGSTEGVTGTIRDLTPEVEGLSAAVEDLVSSLTGATAERQLRDLTLAWRSLTNEQRANPKVVDNVLGAYASLRANVTDPSALPTDLERLRATTFRLTDAHVKQIETSKQLETWMVERLVPGFGSFEDSTRRARRPIIGVTDAMLDMQGQVSGLTGSFSRLASTFAGFGAMIGPTFRRALEGGGGFLGAIQSLGVQAGDMLGASFSSAVSRSMASGAGVFASGFGKALGKGLGMAIPMVGPVVGSLIGRLFNIGGPSEAEKAGRQSWRSYTDGLARAATPEQIQQALSAGWENATDAQGWIVFSDAVMAAGGTMQEAEVIWGRYIAAIKEGPAAVQAVTMEMDAWVEKADSVNETNQMLIGGLRGIIDGGAAAFEPSQLDPYLEQLQQMGLLTEQQAGDLRMMADQAHTDWKAMQAVAEEYGVAMVTVLDENGDEVQEFREDLLGLEFQQAKLTDEAGRLAQGWSLLTGEGTNVGVAIEGMKDEAQAFVSQALEMGLAVPESMRPMLEAMVEQGVLTDENGTKLTDLGGLNFAEPVKDGFQSIVDKLDELIAALTGPLVGAMTSLPTEHQFTVRAKFDDSAIPDVLQPGVDLDIPGFAAGTDGEYGRFSPSGTLAMLHGQEAVTPRAAVPELARDIASALGGSMSGGGGGDIYIALSSDGQASRVTRAQFKAIERAAQGGLLRIPASAIGDQGI